MKEVRFAGEFMQVTEHGRKPIRLCIARFTQEVGAASSFTMVLDQLEETLSQAQLLVVDERKKRRMIKTLNSA